MLAVREMEWGRVMSPRRVTLGQYIKNRRRVLGMTQVEMAELLDHNTTHYWLRKGCERSGVRKVRTHDLRHTYATLALRAGTPIVVVSRRLGHASPDITWKLYQHHLSGEGRDAADQIARVLAG